MSIKEQLIKEIELLPENILLDISAIIKERIALNGGKFNNVGEKRRALSGCMKGKTRISEDFDAPLEELKEYME